MKIKKLLAMLLALSIVVSLAAPVLADEGIGGDEDIAVSESDVSEPEVIPEPEESESGDSSQPEEEPGDVSSQPDEEEPGEEEPGDVSEPGEEEHVHSYSETTSVDPTCTADGEKTFTCGECGDSYTETIPTSGHSWSSDVVEVATCSHSGTLRLTCTVCGAEETETIEPLEHAWDGGETVIEATCTQGGEVLYTCANCGETKTETVEMLPHSWNEGDTVTEATCTQGGEVLYTCTACGETKTETTSVLEHTWTEEITVPATCTQTGEKTMTCELCGETRTEAIDALGHSWDEGVVTTEPTATEDGVRTFTCSVCGETKTETIPTDANAAAEAEKQQKMDELISSLKGATSKVMFNAIREAFASLFDQLPEDVKAELAAFFESLPSGVQGDLYDRLMAAQTMEEFEAILDEYTEEEIIAVEKNLTEDQIAALEAHIQALAEASYVPPVSVPFTEAGPLMHAVEVETSYRAPRRARAMNSQDDTIQTSKILSAWDSATKTGTLKIEAYVTGTYSITESTNIKPVDIVLVLDQSGSMAFDFDGNSTSNVANRRQTAMKNAVSNFIDKVASNYTSTADHRMAIVTFGSSAQVKQGWIDVGVGKDSLKKVVNDLPQSPSGATRIDQGVGESEKLMGTDYNYNGQNTERKKVVIVFTDGVPTSGTEFEVSLANNAISSALNLKNSGVAVYTIGIFNGSNPEQLFGDGCDGTVNSSWEKDEWGIFPGGDFPEVDVPAGNRFLNYLSNNAPKATEVGLKSEKIGWGILHSGKKYTITKNAECNTKAGYYLTAAAASDLDKIFEKINDQIGAGGTTVQLNAQSVVRDVISPYFEVNTSNASGLKAYGVPYTANGTFDDSRTTGSYTVTANGKVVDASGFNFNEKYIAETGRDPNGENPTGDYYGEKLVIEIPIKAEDDFWGGNNVPTNDMNTSGVFMTSTSDKPEVGLGNTSPTANVPLHTPELEGSEWNVYYGDSNALNGKTLVSLKDANVEAWQIAYIAKEGNNPKLNMSSGSPLGDYDYKTDKNVEVTAYLEPSQPADPSSAGTAQIKSTEAKAAVTVNVYTPTVTFPDMRTYLTVQPNLNDNGENATVVWKHGETLSTSTNVEMEGVAPELTYEIKGRVKALGHENPIVRDYYAFVESVKFSTMDTSIQHRSADGTKLNQDVVNFAHKGCDDIQLNQTTLPNDAGEFLVHVFKPEITFIDTEAYKGEDATTFNFEKDGAKLYSVNWTYPGTLVDYANLVMPDENIKPNVTITGYSLDTSKLYDKQYFNNEAVPVAVQVKVGNMTEYIPAGATTPHNINNCVTFHWNHEGCNLDAPSTLNPKMPAEDIYRFYVHVKARELTVTKMIDGAVYSNTDSFLFTIKGTGNPLAETVNTEIFITGAGSKTITGLPVGSYTVTEDGNWSWRYTVQGGDEQPVQLRSGDIESGTVIITNKLTNTKWLSNEDVKVNTFLCVNKTIEPRITLDAILPEKQDEGI